MDGVDDGFEASSQWGDRVFHLRRDLRIDLPKHNAILLKLSELLSEHLLRDAGHGAAEI